MLPHDTRVCASMVCDRPAIGSPFCYGHIQRKHRGLDIDVPLRAYRGPIADRFWPKAGGTNDLDACWPWTGSLHHRGYGNFRVNRKVEKAHRIAWELTYGPIPDQMTIDHLCHTNDPLCSGGDPCLHRRCVNPAHLEVVPMGVNVARGLGQSAQNRRKTHCIRGHAFTAENASFYPLPNGRTRRTCRTCRNLLYQGAHSV